SATGPAHLGNQNRFFTPDLLDGLVGSDDIVVRRVQLFAQPVGQEVGADKVDRLAEVGGFLLDPEIPGVGGGDRHLAVESLAHVIDVGDQILAGQFLAQQGFVADDDAVDIRIGVDDVDQPVQFPQVFLALVGQPATDSHRHAVLCGQARNLGLHVFDGVDAHVFGVRGHQSQILVDLLPRWVYVFDRTLIGAEGRVGVAGNFLRPGRYFTVGAVE